MNSVPEKNYNTLLLLLILFAFSMRLYGIWFPRWGFDEEQYYQGGINLVNFFHALITFDFASLTEIEIVSIYGVLGKYLSVPCVLLGSFIENVFNIPFQIPPGLVLTRLITSFFPNIFIFYFTFNMCSLLSVNNVFKVSYLILLTFAFNIVETAHYAVPDSLSSLLVASCLYYLMKFVLVEFKKKYLYLSSFSAAMAACTKINVGVILLATIFATIIYYSSIYYKKHKIIDYLQTSILVFFLSFLIINLPYLISYRKWLNEIYSHIATFPFEVKGNFFSYFFDAPPMGVGGSVILLVFAGIIVVVILKKKCFIIPAIFCFLFYLFLSTSKGGVHRWIIPMTPIMLFFGAAFLEYVYEKTILNNSKVIAVTLVGVILSGTLIYPFYNILLHDLTLVETPDIYAEVKQYVESSLPIGHCGGCYIGVDLNGVETKAPKDIETLNNNGMQYLVFTDFWFLEREYPGFLLDMISLNRWRNGDWETIRRYAETNWKLLKVFRPKFYCKWGLNKSKQQIFYIYQKTSLSK